MSLYQNKLIIDFITVWANNTQNSQLKTFRGGAGDGGVASAFLNNLLLFYISSIPF